MTFKDLINTAQQGFQNVGQNLQANRLPSPFLPQADPLEAKRIDLLNQRANLTKQNRDLQEEIAYEMDPVRLRSEAINNGWEPTVEEDMIELGGRKQPPLVSPTPTPMPQAERVLKVEDYQGVSPSSIPLPQQNIQDLLWEFLPNEATQSAVALAGENASFDPDAENKNNDGSIDYGLMQNNNRTLQEMLEKQKFAAMLNEAGIFEPIDVKGDARKSVAASKITRDYEDAPVFWGDTQGRPDWSSWYGWQNKGYNMFPDQDIEDVAKNPAYFKLLERLNNN